MVICQNQVFDFRELRLSSLKTTLIPNRGLGQFLITAQSSNTGEISASQQSLRTRPRQGKVDNWLLPGKTVKVSGKG